MEYDTKSEEGVMKLAEDYATFYLIKSYLDTKDIKVLDRLKDMLHKSIKDRESKSFEKPIDIPIQNEESIATIAPKENLTQYIEKVRTIKKRISF